MDSKSRQLSPKQKEVLVDFLHARPDMYKGKLTATYTNAISIALWKEVAIILNAMPGGTTKDWKQWRKTWTDIKKNVKSRASKEKQYSQATGGGPPLPPLDNIEKTTNEKILEIITPVAIQGNQYVPVPEILFEDIVVVNPELTEQFCESNEIDDAMEVDTLKEENTHIPKSRLDHNCCTLPERNISTAVATNKKNEESEGKVPNVSLKKRYTKSAKLKDSIRNNKKFLEINQKSMEVTDAYRERKLQLIAKYHKMKENYYQKKIEALETKSNYDKRKIEILTEISNTISQIAKK